MVHWWVLVSIARETVLVGTCGFFLYEFFWPNFHQFEKYFFENILLRIPLFFGKEFARSFYYY
jgi:hypothetical protein